MPSNSDGWTIRQLEELAKCETDNDAKRVAKKAIAVTTASPRFESPMQTTIGDTFTA